MTLIEFEMANEKKLSIVAEHIHGISERDSNTTLIIMSRMHTDTDDDFIVDEPYLKVKKMLAETVL